MFIDLKKYALLLIRIFNIKFVKKVKGFNQREFEFFLKQTNSISFFGDNQKDKIFYLFEINSEAGIGAYLIWAINFLYVCKKYGFQPILITSESNLFYDEEYTNDKGKTKNIFKYYFDHKSFFYEEFDSINYSNVIMHKIYNDNFPKLLGGYIDYFDSNKLQEASVIFKEYFIFQKNTRNYFQKLFDDLFGASKVIGVHFRSTDYAHKAQSGHPRQVSISDYFNEIDKFNNNDYKIYIATDSFESIDLFKQKYPNIIYIEETFLSSDNNGPQYSTSNRTFHKYLLGFEALRDSYILSKVDIFIGGLSSIATLARIMNYSRENSYEKDIKISNGVYKHEDELL